MTVLLCATRGTQPGSEWRHRTNGSGFNGCHSQRLQPNDWWQWHRLVTAEPIANFEPSRHPCLPADQRFGWAWALVCPLPHCVRLGKENHWGQRGAGHCRQCSCLSSSSQIFCSHHPERSMLPESPAEHHWQHVVCRIHRGQPGELPWRWWQSTRYALWFNPLSDRCGGLGAGL